jgi:uncharacterized protein
MAAQLAVHVTPKAGRDEVAGWRGRELQVRVTVAPEDGKANAAVCALLAKTLRVPKSSVRVARGDTSRHKILEFATLDDAALRKTFGTAEEGV